jgi:toxin ParE1/3/4
MVRITRRPLAAADILDIWGHIAEDSIEQADQWFDKLDEKFGLIATQPLMGRARDELAAELRSFPFGRYVTFYAPIEDGIDVVRVIHSARDIDAVFGEISRQGHPALNLCDRNRSHAGVPACLRACVPACRRAECCGAATCSDFPC